MCTVLHTSHEQIIRLTLSHTIPCETILYCCQEYDFSDLSTLVLSEILYDDPSQSTSQSSHDGQDTNHHTDDHEPWGRLVVVLFPGDSQLFFFLGRSILENTPRSEISHHGVGSLLRNLGSDGFGDTDKERHPGVSRSGVNGGRGGSRVALNLEECRVMVFRPLLNLSLANDVVS